MALIRTFLWLHLPELQKQLNLEFIHNHIYLLQMHELLKLTIVLKKRKKDPDPIIRRKQKLG